MTYVWQQNKSFTRPLIQGMQVHLNPAWIGYDYLKKEYGHMFPARVKSIVSVGGGDIVSIVKNGRELDFARQTLTN